MESDQRLGELLSLLERSYTCKDTAQLKQISKSITAFSKNYYDYLELLFKGLSLTHFNNSQISLDLHKSLAVNLKNIIIENNKNMKNQEIIAVLQKIFDLFFNTNSNTNLFKESIISIFEAIISFLPAEEVKTHSENLFQTLSQKIVQYSTQPINFINIANIVLKFCKAFIDLKILDKDNYFKIINDYYLAIIDNIFKNVPIFIDPNKHMFNDDYFSLLNNLIEDIYYNFKNISKIDNIDNVQFNEIMMKIFNKYSPLIYELMKIQIPFDEKSQKLFINQNSIIVFSSDEKKCKNINYMKSKCFQFFTFITEILSFRNKTKQLNGFAIIKNEKLIEINAELIKSIISSLQDILNNKEKYDVVNCPKNGLFQYDSSYNVLLFNMILLLIRCFTREPIKSEFSQHIKYFLLNIIFPLVTSSEEEKYFLDNEPDTYEIYINDILYEFKCRNFRTALCYLIRRICDIFQETKNFILSYVTEMLSYLFDQTNNTGNTDNKEKIDIINKYSIYLNSENKSLINNFNEEIKIDFCLLILLILKEDVIQNILTKNKFFFFIIKNQDKIHQINSNLILIKICRIYREYSSHLFEFLQFENELSVKKNIIEKMVNFLLGLILSNKKDESLKEAIVTEASEAILNLLKFVVNANSNSDYIKNITIEKLKLCFKNLVKLIDVFDNSSLNIVVASIIEQIHIDERQDILKCIDNYTKKFISIVNTNYNYINSDDEINNKGLFINQYFMIIKNYLRAENKFDNLNQNEIIEFNKIITPVISYISKPKKYAFYEEIVNLGEYCLNAFNSITENIISILDNLYPIIEADKTLCGNYYSFLSTFLSYLNNNENNKIYIKKIVDIIKLISSTLSENNNSEDILPLLLLIFQLLGFTGQIEQENIKLFFLEDIKWYLYLFKNQEDHDFNELFILYDSFSIDKIWQVLGANISLSFIYYPEITLNIINENSNLIFTQDNIFNNLSDFIYKLYSSLFNYIYYPNLGKCMILCLCSFFKNPNLLHSIFDDLEKELALLRLLVNFIVKHKEETVKTKSKITKDDLNCDFVNEDEEKLDNEFDVDIDDSFEDFDNNFYDNVIKCLKTHPLIDKCDEFKIFSETFNNIKCNNEPLFNKLDNCFSKPEKKVINNLLFLRNVTVEYNGKKFDVPRKTLKIKRNVHQ